MVEGERVFLIRKLSDWRNWGFGGKIWYFWGKGFFFLFNIEYRVSCIESRVGMEKF